MDGNSPPAIEARSGGFIKYVRPTDFKKVGAALLRIINSKDHILYSSNDSDGSSCDAFDDDIKNLFDSNQIDSFSQEKIINEAIDDNGNTPLFAIINLGYDFLVKNGMIEALTKRGADLNAKNSDGKTALMMALQKGDVFMFDFLIQLGADKKIRDDQGNDLLDHAIASGDKKMVNYLLGFGFDFNAGGERGITPMMNAVIKSDVSRVRFLHKLGADLKVRDDEGKTIMMWALEVGDQDMVDCLVGFGVDFYVDDDSGRTLFMKELEEDNGNYRSIGLLGKNSMTLNAQDNKGKTALIRCAEQGNTAMCKLLISKFKADLYIKDQNGDTALSVFASQGNFEMLQFMVEKITSLRIEPEVRKLFLTKAIDAGRSDMVEFFSKFEDNSLGVTKRSPTPLMKSVERGSLKMIGPLAQFEIDKDNNGLALIHALKLGQFKSVEILASSKNVNLNVRDEEGQTALMYAVDDIDSNNIKCLIRNGADLDVKDPFGKTALAKAAMFDKVKKVRLLADYGADLNICDIRGRTILMDFASRSNVDMVDFLARKGADLNIVNNVKETALIEAIDREDYKIVEILVKKGANLDIGDGLGQTALMKAVKMGDEKMAKLLIEGGADLNVQDNLGRTAAIISLEKIGVTASSILLSNNLSIPKSADLICKSSIFHMLREAGADLNIEDNLGRKCFYAEIFPNHANKGLDSSKKGPSTSPKNAALQDSGSQTSGFSIKV